MKSGWVYIALCLFAPLLWGVVSARVFDWFAGRRKTEGKAVEDSEMYYI